jgi:hypothetical protein
MQIGDKHFPVLAPSTSYETALKNLKIDPESPQIIYFRQQITD